MNRLLRILIMMWLMFSGCAIWVMLMIGGFLSAFTSNLYLMYNITPFVGITCWICIIICMKRVSLSNPATYVASKVGQLLGKAKI